MSALYQFDKMGAGSPEVVCYEKGNTWCGLWNYTWMTGTDEFGEPCHGGQYKYLWSNGPKECLEYPDYTFDEHYGKAIPSFPPRPVLRNYLEGRFTKKNKTDLKRFIKWNTVVRQVRYNKATDNFTVTAEDLKARHTYDDTFTHVIVATGIFNVPNKPTFPGIETFNGQIIHSHDFRDAKEYKGQRLLIVGGRYSAEDISMQCMKYGAKSVVTSYRTKPMNFKFPPGIEERPLVTKITNNTIHFKDGSTAEVDAIILCTGYLYQFPYLDDDLRLYSTLSVYSAGLYKGTLWLKGGNNKLFYLGTQDQYFSFSMFDVQALWVCKFIENHNSEMMSEKPKVCIIGAGPCGVSALFHFDQMGNQAPEIVCYEKGNTWLGLWNFTWRTGTDEYGEPCHGGMYKHLWSNGPKECLEYPDYTFDDHYGKVIPSFPPRLVLRDYMEDRFNKKSKKDLKRFIKWNNVVRQVRYNKETDKFTVTVEDLKARHTVDDIFTHVIVSTGIFNVPNKPAFPGMETFTGRIIHSHDFRDAYEFKGQRLLIVGASYSAEDIALQCLKFGAKSVLTSYRTKPMNLKWPSGIEERPLIVKIDKNNVHFKDGTMATVDSIILSTGYQYHFQFLGDDLRLYSTLSLYPADLYKGALWLKGGNNKLFYMGTQDQYYTFTMFDVQALWICKYITGMLPNEPKSMNEMRQDEQKWVKRCEGLVDCYGGIDLQSDFVKDLSESTGYHPDAQKGRELFYAWEHNRDDNIVTYRDKQFKSLFTGKESAKHKAWWEDFDDTIASFVK